MNITLSVRRRRSKVVISSAKPEDSGRYECVAESTSGHRASLAAQLLVAHDTRVSETSEYHRSFRVRVHIVRLYLCNKREANREWSIYLFRDTNPCLSLSISLIKILQKHDTLASLKTRQLRYSSVDRRYKNGRRNVREQRERGTRFVRCRLDFR